MTCEQAERKVPVRFAINWKENWKEGVADVFLLGINMFFKTDSLGHTVRID